jgi:hypothetical protein
LEGKYEKGTAVNSAPAAPGLSDSELAESLALTKGADSVELKLTVPLSDRSRAEFFSQRLQATVG